MLSRPLRLAMVTTFYPPYCTDHDGYDVQRWARALTARGHCVDVIHDTDAYRLLTGRVPEIPFEDDGIRVHRLRSKTKFLSSLSVQQLGRPTTHKARLEELLTGRYDVIHYHNISLIGGPGVWSIGTGVKLHTAHDFWLACPSHDLWRDNKELCDAKRCIRCVYRQGRPPQFWRLSRRMRNHAEHVDAFLVPSASAAEIHASFGFPMPMHVMPTISAVSAPRLKDASEGLGSGRPFVFFTGPLEDIQGVSEIIAGLDEDPGADLVIAGIGRDEGRWRRRAHGKPWVRLIGPQSDRTQRALRRDALAVLAPRQGYEVFPNTILEAFRAGKPVLARRVGPNPDIITRSGAGLLFGSAREACEQIKRLVREPDFAAELGRLGFAFFAENWREDVAIDAYFDLIREVAERRGFEDLIAKIDDAPSRFIEEASSEVTPLSSA